MGGRGSSSGLTQRVRLRNPLQPPQPPQSPQQPQLQPINPSQPPDDQNTPVVPDATLNLTTMTDDELAQAVMASKNVQMPNMLSDVDDVTQRFIYQIGANEKPLVLDDQAFDKFMADNGIDQKQILSRVVNPMTYTNNDGTRITMTADRISQMLKYSRLNYIGGKHGGQVYGAGTYLDMNGGGDTGYGSSKVINGVLNPATARVITNDQLRVQAAAFARSHPKFARAVGPYDSSYIGGSNNMSIYAMAMGYNVIKDGTGSYHNVIDRRAIVYRRDDR